VKSNFSSSFN